MAKSSGNWYRSESLPRYRTKIVRCNYEWWRGRQVTSGPEKLIASAESLPLLISRRKKPDFHDFDLHSPLKDIKSVTELRRGT